MYAFVHIEKTAGRTVRAILQRSFGAGHCEIRTPYSRREDEWGDRRVHVTAQDLHRVRRIYRRLRGIAGHNVKAYSDLDRECPDVRYFTFLRDPVKRYLSHYLNRSRAYSLADFDRWVASGWPNDWQTKMIAGEASAQKAIDLLGSRIGFVGLTETFDESVLMLGQWLGYADYRPEYQRVNRLEVKNRERDKVREQTDTSYLKDPAFLERVRAINSMDQQVYDFAARELCARQRTTYRGDLAADVAALRARNATETDWEEPRSARLLRNFVYKPALLLRLA